MDRGGETNLAAAVVTQVTLEPLLVLVGFLVLDESVALVEDSVAVSTLLSRLDEGVLLTQVNAFTWTWTGRDSRSGGDGSESEEMVGSCTLALHVSVLPRSLLRAMTVSQ